MLSIRRFALCLLLLVCTNVHLASAQTVSNFDLEGFRAAAVIAEADIESSTSSSAYLERLRIDMSEWRDLSLQEQEKEKTKVDEVQTRLDALGPKPEEGIEEAKEVAARRKELLADLANTSGPLRTAEEAYARADGIINGIDKIIRLRQQSALIEVGPSPLNPARWPVVWVEFDNYIAGLRTEITSAWSNPFKARIRLQNTPFLIFLTAISIVLIAPGRRWLLGQWRTVTENTHDRFSGVRAIILSFLTLILPILGVSILTYVIGLFDILTYNGTGLVAALPIAFAYVFGAIWLVSGLRPLSGLLFGTDHSELHAVGQGRRTILILGWVMMAKTLLDAVNETQLWVPATYSVLHFPLVIIGSIGLWRISKLLRHIARFGKEDDGPETLIIKVARFGSLISLVISFVGPIACAVGYTKLGSTLVFSSIITLALTVSLWLFYRQLGQLSEVFWPDRPAVPGDQNRSGALFNVTLGFGLICLAIPLVALIWGARVSDLSEFWISMREGVALGDTRISLTDFLTFIVVFAFGYALTRFIQSALKSTVLPNTRMDPGAQSALVTGAGYVGIFIAALLAITSTGLDLSNLTIVAGALSVGVGFGLQAIVSNFVSGIILLIERPINKGDWIEVGAHSGYVVDISVRSTTIETFDRATVIVPNADLISSSVTNWTHGTPTGRVRVPVGVGYTSDPDHVKDVLFAIAEAHPMVLRNPSPSIVFMGFGADSMDFEIRVIIRDVNWMLSVRSDMNYEIVRKFREENIEIPFAQREITIKNASDFVPAAKPIPKTKPKS